MSFPTLPIKLSFSHQSEKEAITDALYRVLHGFDNNDHVMFDSGWIGPDVVFVMDENETQGLETIRDQFLNLVGPMETMHMISNVRIHMEDDQKTAALTCYALSQHAPPGKGNEDDGPKYMSGSRYYIDLIKDEGDGLWKCSKFQMKIVWRQGDRSVMQRSQ